MTGSAIQERVTPHFAGLSPQVRRAARFVLENPDEVATRSLRHIAGKADLSPTTFSRLARALGCASYEELRELCRDEIRVRKTRFADKALKLLEPEPEGPAAGARPYLVRHAASAITNIQLLLEGVDLERLEEAARRLAAAKRVALIGTLGAYAFIDHTAFLARMAFENWSVVGAGGSSVGSGLAGLGPEDAVLVVTLEPYSRRSVEAARLAHSLGAHVIAVSDGGHSPLAEVAGSLFTVSTDGPQYFTSYVSTLVLLEALMGMVLRAKGAQAQERVAEVERQNHLLGEYWQD